MKTPIAYYGGKQNLVEHILPLIPAHRQYVEPFFGGGAVFFKKRKSKNEVINDLDDRVVNFYQQMQGNFEDLQLLIWQTLHSESEHRRAQEMLKSGGGSPVERAWAFWVQCNMSFGHMMFGGFAFSEGGQASATNQKRKVFTSAFMQRLEGTEIFCRDAIELIKLKDSPDTFFYIDPPYVSSEKGHYEGYTAEHFQALLITLAGIQGKFLLSSYPEASLLQAREQFGWNGRDIKQVLQVTGKREETKYKVECLTYNYNLHAKQNFIDL